ncbi:hypothetical protein DSM21852_13370 [Methylocystis bryophila]|nr:hypothetical protein DSM21852_13370 [Methylocystis bryophila]
MRLVENVVIGLAVQIGLDLTLLFEVVEIFEKEQPRRLLGVVELGRAAGLFPQHVVEIFEGLLEHVSLARKGRQMA